MQMILYLKLRKQMVFEVCFFIIFSCSFVMLRYINYWVQIGLAKSPYM